MHSKIWASRIVIFTAGQTIDPIAEVVSARWSNRRLPSQNLCETQSWPVIWPKFYSEHLGA